MSTFRDKLVKEIAAKKQADVDARRAAQETIQKQAEERRAKVEKTANLMEGVLKQAVDALNASDVSATLKPLAGKDSKDGVAGHVLTFTSNGTSQKLVLNYALDSIETNSHHGPLEFDKLSTETDAENFVRHQLEKLGML
jgi:hypothetical protein